MKLTAAVIAASTTVFLTTAILGAAWLRQDARHQAERSEAVLAGNQFHRLAQMSAKPDLAELWRPEDIEAEEYMWLVSANRRICTLSLHDRLGFTRDGQLPFFASMVMTIDVCRRYWARFGDLRAQEAEGDERAERFTRVLEAAARFHPDHSGLTGLEHPWPLPALRHSALFVSAPHMRHPFSGAF